MHVPRGDEYLCAGEAAYRCALTDWAPPWDWESRGNFRGHLAGARNERPLLTPLATVIALEVGVQSGVLTGWRAVATPGHGKSARTLLVELDGRTVAFCGDLVCGEGQLWNWFDADWDYGLQNGQRTLLASACALGDEAFEWLLPAHGPMPTDGHRALRLLAERLEAVLHDEPMNIDPAQLAFPDSAARGFRKLSACLHHYKIGNCTVLLSRTGNALLVDDGLCFWKPLPERVEHHRAVMAHLKEALGIARFEVVIPTHFHGDHTENIPALVADEGAQVVALDVVADPMEHPERFNLACSLPWYGTGEGCVSVHRRLANGSVFQWHEHKLRLFHLGGQTFHHLGIALEVDGQRVVFAGDALADNGPLCEPVMCYNDAEPSERGWLYAFERLIAEQPDLLVCGHGIAIQNPSALLKAKHSAWQARLRAYDALNARPTRRAFFDPFYESAK